jgi:TetR/AcrR family transcriptional regulator, transcriptional repressor for nem operon
MRKHGYGATGIQEILQAAAVPKGSFYHHFRSKEGFAAALIGQYEALSASHCRTMLGDKGTSPLRRLRRYFEDLIRIAGQSAPIPGCLLGTLSLEVASTSPLLQERLHSSFALWRSEIASVLREAVEKGELSQSVKSERLADFILNSWEGALLRSQADKSDAPLKEFVCYIFQELLQK